MVDESDTVAADEVSLAMNTEIMVGRVEVMQDQTKRGLDVLAGLSVPPESAHEPTEGIDTYRRLYNAVERYNALRGSACRAKVLSDADCGGPLYMPIWYAGRARPDTSLSGLATMAEDMQNQMIPLWSGVCEKVVAKSGDDQFCAIE